MQNYKRQRLDQILSVYFSLKLVKINKLFRPPSPYECEQVHTKYTIDRSLERGGFPELFLAQDVINTNR